MRCSTVAPGAACARQGKGLGRCIHWKMLIRVIVQGISSKLQHIRGWCWRSPPASESNIEMLASTWSSLSSMAAYLTESTGVGLDTEVEEVEARADGLEDEVEESAAEGPKHEE